MGWAGAGLSLALLPPHRAQKTVWNISSISPCRIWGVNRHSQRFPCRVATGRSCSAQGLQGGAGPREGLLHRGGSAWARESRRLQGASRLDSRELRPLQRAEESCSHCWSWLAPWSLGRSPLGPSPPLGPVVAKSQTGPTHLEAASPCRAKSPRGRCSPFGVLVLRPPPHCLKASASCQPEMLLLVPLRCQKDIFIRSVLRKRQSCTCFQRGKSAAAQDPGASQGLATAVERLGQSVTPFRS